MDPEPIWPVVRDALGPSPQPLEHFVAAVDARLPPTTAPDSRRSTVERALEYLESTWDALSITIAGEQRWQVH